MIQDREEQSDDNHLVKANTATNAAISLAIAVLNTSLHPICQCSQHKYRTTAAAVIPQMIWRNVNPFDDINNINSASTEIKIFWSDYDEINEYSPSIPHCEDHGIH